MKRFSTPVSWLGSALALLVPKCPACFAAWAGVLGSLNLADGHLRGALGVALFVSLAALAYSARSHRRWAALGMAGLGGLVLVVGRVSTSDATMAIGAGLLASALVVDLLSRRFPRRNRAEAARSTCCKPVLGAERA